MSLTSLTVDSKDLSTLGLILDRPIGWRHSAPRAHRYVQIPKRRGYLKVTKTPVWEPRRLVLTGHIEGSSLAQLRTRHREIVHRLSDGLLTCSFSDASTEVFYAYMDEDGVEVDPVGPALKSKRHAVTINLVCPDPRIYENATTTVTSTTTAATDVPLGTAPVEPVIQVTTASTVVSLIYKTSTGGTLATFGLTGPGGSSPYSIDMKAQTALSSTGLSVISALTTGTDFFVLDPFDGDWPSSGWPTVQMTNGSSMTITYQKAYL